MGQSVFVHQEHKSVDEVVPTIAGVVPEMAGPRNTRRSVHGGRPSLLVPLVGKGGQDLFPGGIDSTPVPESTTLLLTVMDNLGNLVFLFCQGQRMVKVYSCNEHVEKTYTIEDLLCGQSGITVLLNNGDLRYFEYVLQDQIIQLSDVPMSI